MMTFAKLLYIHMDGVYVCVLTCYSTVQKLSRLFSWLLGSSWGSSSRYWKDTWLM